MFRAGPPTLLAIPLLLATLAAQHDPWQALARGDAAAARDRFLAAAGAGDEVGAALAVELTRRLGDWDQVERALRDAATAAADPRVRDRLQAWRFEAARAAGRTSVLRELTPELGLLTGWWIVGPFDNERGAGFKRALPPEQGIDPDAVYDGKKRPVRWRRQPTDALADGRIDLDAVVRPNDQVLCYAATVVHAEREQDALLWLGSDEAVVFWLNGESLLSRDVRRPLHADQDAVPVRLAAGPNLLLLKVCDQEGPFGFTARLTKPEGGPLQGVVERCSAEDLRQASATKPPAAKPTSPSLGARTQLAQAAAGGDLDAAFRLAHYLLLLAPDDPNERRDHELARQLVAARPQDPAAHDLLARTRVRPAQHEAEKDDNPRRHDYGRALTADPDYVPALLGLAQIELDGTNNGRAAEQLLRRALAIAPQNATARRLLAEALRHQDLTPLDDREILAAAQQHAGDPRLQDEAGNVQARQERIADSLRHRQLALQAEWRRPRVDGLLQLLLRTGRTDEARVLFTRAVELDPFDRQPRQRMADWQRAQGDYAGALQTWRDWLVICPEDDEALVEVAVVQGLAGDRDGEIESLRRALDLNPNRKEQRRLLEFLEADLKPFYTDYQLDGDAVIAADGGPPADAKTANDPLHDLLRQEVVVAYRGGTTSSYEHVIRRVLTEQGARELDRWFVPHAFGEQRARILLARVRKPDGSILRPKLQGFWVDLPPLQPGDIVELQSRVDDLAPTFFGDIFGLQHSFASRDGNPVARSELVTILEPGRDYHLQSVHGAPQPETSTDAAGRTVHVWRMRDVARSAVEERSPSWRETVPLARVTTYRDWNHFSQWWWNLIRRQIEVSPEMQAKVRELTAGLTDEMAKIAAIYRFVTTDVRYTAWEFGVHGYKPYSTPVIFERRHGDCKDKALLLTAMLGEIDVEAWPVLIWADPLRSADDLALPLVHHFNHCISYLPASGERAAMFLDGTAIYHPLDTVPEMDQGARVLVVKEGDGELLDLPWTDAERNDDRRTIELAVRPDGGGRGRVALTPTGNEAVALREELGNEPQKQREKIERMLTQEFGKSQVQALQTSDLLDLHAPVRVEIEFDVEQALERQQGALMLKSRFLRDTLPTLARAESRTLPLLLGVPGSASSTLRYKLPAGWNVDALPPPVEIERPFASYSLQWRQDGNDVVVERRLLRRSPRIEPAEYAEFREFVQAVDVADERVVALRRGGER